MRIQSIQTNTNFQGLGHKLVRMQKLQKGQSIVQRFSENVMQESKSEITKEIKKPTKEWFDNWFDSYINAQNATAMAAKILVGSKDILGVLETKEVQASEGEMLDSKFVTKTISYLLNEAKPDEKTVIVNKLAKLPKINYNQVDENDISILEHILNAEDFQLLDLVSKTKLDYHTQLDYTYENIKNPAFKKEVDKLNLNFEDLKVAVRSENKEVLADVVDDFSSPFYKVEVQGKELADIAIKEVENINFYDYLVSVYDGYLFI